MEYVRCSNARTYVRLQTVQIAHSLPASPRVQRRTQPTHAQVQGSARVVVHDHPLCRARVRNRRERGLPDADGSSFPLYSPADHRQPVWAIFFCVGLGAIFLVPIGIITAITNVEVSSP